jgi:hypothetical protein
MLSDRDRELIKSAEELASNYDGDDRQDIKTDVMNAFYAGAKFLAERDALAIKEKDDAVREFGLEMFKRGQLASGAVSIVAEQIVDEAIRALIEPKKE